MKLTTAKPASAESELPCLKWKPDCWGLCCFAALRWPWSYECYNKVNMYRTSSLTIIQCTWRLQAPFLCSWASRWSQEAAVPEGQPFVFPSGISYLQTPGNADDRNKKIGHTSVISNFRNDKGTQRRGQESVSHFWWICLTVLLVFFREITFYFML